MFEIEIKGEKKSYKQLSSVSQYDRYNTEKNILPFQFYSDCLGPGEYIISSLFSKDLFPKQGENIIECYLFKDNELVDTKKFNELPLATSSLRGLKVMYYYYYRGLKK